MMSCIPIMLASTPRSGTNYLHGVMAKSSRDVMTCYEIFNKKAVFCTNNYLKDLSGKLKTDFKSIRDTRLVDYAREDKSRFISNLLDIANERGRKYLLFKIFPDQIEDNLEKLNEINNIKVIILTRHPIECFISLTKAASLKSWTKTDTTAIKPSINLKKFLAWHNKTSKWYEQWANAKVFSRYSLTYENDIKGVHPALLFNIINTKLNLGLTIADQYEPSNQLQLQDKTENWRNKVSNGLEFYSQALDINAEAKLYRYYSTDT